MKDISVLKSVLKNKRLIVASGSPRRKDLLAEIGLSFDVIPSNFQEDLNVADFPVYSDYVIETAYQKVLDVWSQLTTKTDVIVIGADTVVALDNTIYGKPNNPEHAASMLRQFSGKVHEVCTAVVLKSDLAVRKFSTTTTVLMRAFGENEIEDYVKTGEPMDKAGSYGIQGKGKDLVAKIDGDFNNVVGLPVDDLCNELLLLLNNS